MYKQPWAVTGVPWKTEAAFWGWVRGILRKGWSKHPVKLEYIKQHRKRIKNPNPKGKLQEVWGMTCQQCRCNVVQGNIEIDHVGDNASFTGLHDAESYIKHLFLVDFQSLESCCKECHSIRSHAQNKGITFEEAELEKYIINLLKVEQKSAIILFIESWDFNEEYLTGNESQRRKALVEIFRNIYKGE